MMRAIGAGAAAFIVAAVIVLSGANPDPSLGSASLTSDMTGAWAGDARIAVDWTKARTLPVRLTVGPDGAVTGTVGDAVLRGARLAPNRTAIGRALHIKTDWAVRGSLDGHLIKAEGIRRESVTIPLNFVDGRFEGGVNTSGSHFGGRDSMWLAAKQLVLDRVRPAH